MSSIILSILVGATIWHTNILDKIIKQVYNVPIGMRGVIYIYNTDKHISTPRVFLGILSGVYIEYNHYIYPYVYPEIWPLGS